MNLNYEKIKAKGEHGGTAWTSYSDLFTVLSVLFLLLYVVANLRSGTLSIASRSAVQQTKAELEEMKKQIKAYEVLKEDYVKKGATKDEVAVYQELMGKLNLLEEQAKNERDALFKKAQDAKEKEENLNRYQQLVKNIITANLVSQANVKRRDQVIVQKDLVIDEKQQEIAQRTREIETLNENMEQKKTEIEKNNQKIALVQSQLAAKIAEAQEAYRAGEKSKKKMEEQVARLREEGEEKIAALRKANTSVMGQLEQAQAQIEAKNREAEKLLEDLNAKEAGYRDAIAELQKAHGDGLTKQKAAFEAELARTKMGAEERLAKERAFREGLEKQNQAYNDKMKGLQGELDATRSGIKNLADKYQGAIKGLEAANDALKKDLAASMQKLQEQRNLAQKLKNNFAGAGINADIDLKTGDVVVNFEGEYFDTGRADLKHGMRNILEKMIPVYARSLFQDPKVASRIQAVEIVGFASPTYKGKYVNPDSLSPEDRAAVNYNMDLSYQRAKSIFEHAFNPDKMQFPHQKTLLPLVKVTGRSYLATDRVPGRDTANFSDGEYCQKFDCKKSQRVIIKFHLKDNK